VVVRSLVKLRGVESDKVQRGGCSGKYCDSGVSSSAAQLQERSPEKSAEFIKTVESFRIIPTGVTSGGT